ncbi:hypothetical protein NC797_06865 [Aquibacillus sp. 3ASR75-11]|uniref:Uncharacterized protein n=1 Tax=Terrihalobacillus insolitus TaxID=2950438 RepID=A0A9X3WSV7_9BACI|nr:hypothetical protein [Terrihalobacillus insolitus]MDC3424228.1 hypothetical protein [Terrihalobacillus insolitus]
MEHVDETIITCSVCGRNFDEGDVNIIDYDLDLCISCEKKHLESSKEIKGPYDVTYQHYKGNIYISKQNPSQEIQGTNIALGDPFYSDKDLRVLGYVIRKGGKWTHNHDKYMDLDEIIWSVLKSYGWYNEYCYQLLGTS